MPTEHHQRRRATTHKVGPKSDDARRHPFFPNPRRKLRISWHTGCFSTSEVYPIVDRASAAPCKALVTTLFQPLWSASANLGNSLVRAASTACAMASGKDAPIISLPPSLVDPCGFNDVVYEIADAFAFDSYAGTALLLLLRSQRWSAEPRGY